MKDSLAIDPNDSGWGEIAVFGGPLFAAGASIAIGVVLMIVAAPGLVRVAVSRAAIATGLGCAVAPFLYLFSLFGVSLVLNPPTAIQNGLLIFVLPVIAGIAVVLVSAVVLEGILSRRGNG